ncbi:MAG: MATE family efflux transporter [Candidatus Thermoplasmatota archaeon]|nr:MATE family efflux transporter [Candidatus Thermoplasmatota archaeon]
MRLLSGENGTTRRTILALAWPVILANLFQTLTTTVDLLMVGRLPDPAVALAAVGFGGQMVFFTFTIMISITSGTVALIARYVGAKEPEKAGEVLGQSLLLGLILSLPVVLVGFVFGDAIVALFGADPEVVAAGGTYIRTVFLAAPFLFTMFISIAALRGAGDTVTPLLVGVLINVSNVVLNFHLIFGARYALGGLVLDIPSLGVLGAAIGTSISFGIGASVYLILFLRRKLRLQLRRPRPLWNRETTRRILRIGTPAGLEQVAFQAGILIWIAMVVSFGTEAFASHIIGLRIESFAFMPGLGFSIAAAALVGQNLGAKKPVEAERSGRESTKMALLIMGVAALVIFVAAPFIALAFTSDIAVVNLTVLFIRVHSVGIPATAIFFSVSGALRGAGDTRWPFYATLVGIYGLRLPLSFLLGYQLGLGIFGVWVTLPIEYYIRSIIVGRRFRTGAWKAVTV